MKMITKYMIDLKCKKVSRPKKSSPKPFKSGLKVNTIKGLIINPHTNNPAFTFYEDSSFIDCHSIILLDDREKPIHQNDLERQRFVHKKRKENTFEYFKKQFDTALAAMSDDELLSHFPGCEIVENPKKKIFNDMTVAEMEAEIANMSDEEILSHFQEKDDWWTDDDILD